MLRSAIMSLLVAAAGDAQAQALALKAEPVVSGPTVTLGDLFEDAGAAADRALGPSPSPGRTGAYPIRVIEAAARAAGLDWTAPQGLDAVRVRRVGSGAARGTAPAAVGRGDLVTLVYARPGLTLTTKARALSDAAVGQTVRLAAEQTDRTIEAVVTGPGLAQIQATTP